MTVQSRLPVSSVLAPRIAFGSATLIRRSVVGRSKLLVSSAGGVHECNHICGTPEQKYEENRPLHEIGILDEVLRLC